MESKFDLPAMRKASFYKKGSVEVNVFSNGSPDIVGKYKAIFPEGALYQIIYNGGKSWAFYNDTTSNEMTVEYEFGPTSVIEPLGRCEMSVKPGRWISCKLSIYPGCTEKFITGKPNGFRVNYRSGPLSDEYKEHIRRVCERRIQQETEVVRKFNIKPVGIMRDIAMECFRRNVRFVDLQFLPQAQSIARPTDIRKAEVTTWQRPCHYLPSNYKQSLIVSAIEPNDIDQGSLGDCWLMCALACLAEHPSRIMNLLIRHPYEDSIGYYTVQINQSGWWMTVAVDDYLPVNAKVPCFAKNHDERGEMWVAIFEKAFAKVFGSYSALIGGDSLDAIRDLTGAPGVRIDNRWCLAAQNPTGHHALQLFEELMEASSKNWVISVSTPWSSDTEFRMKLKIASIEAFRKSYELVGLSMGHSYSVLEVVEFPQHNLRLLKIRNPWGDGTEWNGSWSDESLMWKRYPDVKAACKCVVSNDGTFWMTFEDVLQYFCSLSLCMVADTPHDYRIRGQFVDGYPSVMLSLTVSVPAKITFLLCNPDLRNRQSEASPPQKATLLHIAEWKASSDSNTYHVIANSTMDHTKRSCDWNFTYSRDQSVTLTLNPSPHPYLVIPNTYEKSSYRQSYVIGLLSDVSLSSKGSVHVKFLQPESNMKLFSKFPQFNLVAKQGINVEFQKYEKGREIPTLHGSSLI